MNLMFYNFNDFNNNNNNGRAIQTATGKRPMTSGVGANKGMRTQQNFYNRKHQQDDKATGGENQKQNEDGHNKFE